jgi:hypothetical protein
LLKIDPTTDSLSTKIYANDLYGDMRHTAEIGYFMAICVAIPVPKDLPIKIIFEFYFASEI